jgi:cytochrome d ubiquinol oxidase subunit I
MDALLLSRVQFGLALGFHYIFPVTTLGLTFYILLFESIYLKTGQEILRQISGFLIRILGIVFVLGVATGLMLPFAFGTNFARLSGVSSELFGVQLAVESMTSFALESVFLSILIFGRGRVSKKLFWISTLIVFFASHLSAFWIVSVNSWMQTPAGFVIGNGRIVITDYFTAIFNHTTVIRFTHVVTAAWLTGAVVVSSIAAWYLLKKQHEEIAKKMLRFGIIGIFILSLKSDTVISCVSSSTNPLRTLPWKAFSRRREELH